MAVIWEIVFERFIMRFLGLYTRYYFFLLTGRKKSISYLAGNDFSDEENGAIQDSFNAVVGLIVLGLLVIGIIHLLN